MPRGVKRQSVPPPAVPVDVPRPEPGKGPAALTPLDYMLKVIRDETADEGRRDEMAKLAAPYMHPKLANADGIAAGGSLDLSHLTEEQLAALEILLGPLARSGNDPRGNPGGEGAAGG
jgi:hypothetical protein